jgi:hypothetical protein
MVGARWRLVMKDEVAALVDICTIYAECNYDPEVKWTTDEVIRLVEHVCQALFHDNKTLAYKAVARLCIRWEVD